MENWYKESFSQDYIRIYQHRDQGEADEDLEKLLSLLNVPENSVCLDLGCGFGRHLATLHSRGILAFGVDLSWDLLMVNPPQIRKKGLLIQADMRRLPFLKNQFDFVFSFFSSFGYFADDSENIQVLNQIQSVLKPGGMLVLDYLNASFIKNHLVPLDSSTFDDFMLTQRRWIDTEINTVEKEIIIQDESGTRSYRERIKLYDKTDFAQMFNKSGLMITRTMGDYDGGTVKDDSSRLIVFGEKSEFSND